MIVQVQKICKILECKNVALVLIGFGRLKKTSKLVSNIKIKHSNLWYSDINYKKWMMVPKENKK